MGRYAFETYDVFTDQRFVGNQLAVLSDARGLSDAQMQTLTREFNYAEATFVLPAEDQANSARVRIFTPAYEMPFAGHPTVGTAVALARARGGPGDLRLELKAGVFLVRVTEAGGVWRAEFDNPNPPRETGAALPAEALEAALGLPPGSVERSAHRPRRVGAGVDFHFAKAQISAVRQAKVNSAAWAELELFGVVGVLLYADGGDLPGSDYHVRMFAPDAGVPEDPATGAAAAAFPGQLLAAGALDEGRTPIRIEQGLEMGRPSRIDVVTEVAAGVIRRVSIGGAAVPVARGEIEI